MNEGNGQIRLTTKIDTKQMEKDLNKMKSDLERFDKEEKKLLEKKENIKFEADTKKAQKRIEELNKNIEVYEKLAARALEKSPKGKDSTAYQIYGKMSNIAEEEKKKLLDEINAKYERIDTAIEKNNDSKQDTINKIEETNAKLTEEKAKEAEVAKEEERRARIKKTLEEAQKNMEKGFKRAFRSVKMFIGGLIGVRAVYGMISKAANAYISSNEKLTKQMEANWLGLGTALAPIIDWIYEKIRKLVTAILYLVGQMTDENLIAKANAAILKKNAEATKKLRKENDKLTASFDEMEVLQDNTKEQDTVETMPLFNENDISQGTRDKLKELAKPLKAILDTIKNIVKFGLEHPELLIVALGGWKVISFLTKIIGKTGQGGSGLLGIQFLLAGMAGYWIGSNISSMVDTLNETREVTDAIDDQIDKRREQAKATADANKKLIQSGKMTNEQTKKMIETNTKDIKTMQDRNKTVVDTLNGYSKAQLTTKNWTGELQNNINTLQTNIYTQWQEIRTMDELYRAGKLNEEEIKDYKEKLAKFNEILNGTSKEAKDTRKWFDYFGDSTANLAKVQEDVKQKMDNVGYGFGRVARDGKLDMQQIKNAINDVPKNNVIKVKTEGVDKAKTAVQGILNNIVDLTKKTFKVKAEVEVTGITSAVSNMADLGVAVLKKIKLASGGIVNNPGRGVALSSNIIAGEAGPEAVLPLNESTMTWLAKLIASNMVVNLTNVTQMNGRQISKEIKKINANEGYAFNI